MVSKRAGSQRPPRQPVDPLARQDRVRDAMRAAAEEWQAGDDGGSGGAGAPAVTASQAGGVPPELLGGDTSAPKPWWAARFEALYLPTLGYPDGSVGFLQVDVSLRSGVRDVRVLTFEDRHDCMHCLAMMRGWPEVGGAALSMGAMATRSLEADIRAAWLAQHSAAEAARWGEDRGVGPQPAGPSPPCGVVVFRRGKLPLRVGMGQDEFMQLVVYHAAAQGALGKVGYGFTD